MKYLKEPSQRVWDTDSILENKKMHRSKAQNARIAEHWRRKAGSRMQAYIISYIFLIDAGCGAYKWMDRKRWQNVVLVSHKAEHGISEKWVFWIMTETVVSLHNFRMNVNSNLRAQEKCKIVGACRQMYNTSYQGKMVKCCSSFHCPGRASWSHPTNSSRCYSDR